MMSTNGLHRSDRRKALKLALIAYDALADEYSKLVARYNALVLSDKPPE